MQGEEDNRATLQYSIQMQELPEEIGRLIEGATTTQLARENFWHMRKKTIFLSIFVKIYICYA